jgi:REP element-mobilizing transposase RayT
MSRVVDRRRVFNDDEKERFLQIMRAAEGFCGVEIMTHSVLSNHFHIVLHVPEREDVSDGLFMSRYRSLYSRRKANRMAARLAEMREAGQHEAAEALKARYTYRMYDISEFLKTLKQRVTMSYNRRHGRKGTLWEERFKSLLVGNSEGALSAVSAYVDLNAVRAGIVSDPKDYRFCGYGEAMGGSKRARAGLARAMCSLDQDSTWNAVSKQYRKLLYTEGEARGVGNADQPLKPGFSPEEVKAVLDAGGTLPVNQVLRCRVRYFSDGAVLGSKAFVEDVFQRHRRRFGEKRKTGARTMVGCQWGDLCTVRRLRLEVITPPAAC